MVGDTLFLMFNAHHEPIRFILPAPGPGGKVGEISRHGKLPVEPPSRLGGTQVERGRGNGSTDGRPAAVEPAFQGAVAYLQAARTPGDCVSFEETGA